MKLDTIKLLQESFNCNEQVAKKLAETLDPVLIAKMVSEKIGAPVKVEIEPKKDQSDVKTVIVLALKKSSPLPIGEIMRLSKSDKEPQAFHNAALKMLKEKVLKRSKRLGVWHYRLNDKAQA